MVVFILELACIFTFAASCDLNFCFFAELAQTITGKKKPCKEVVSERFDGALMTLCKVI